MSETPKRKRSAAPRVSKPSKTKGIESALSIIQIKGQSEAVEPIDGETYQDALRHAVIEMRVRGFTAREIAKEVGKTERHIWNILEAENEAIDQRQTSKEEHKRNAIRRCEKLIQKYYPIAVKDKLEINRFTKDGIEYTDYDAIDVQFQAFASLMKAEERLAKLVGFDKEEDDVERGGMTNDQMLLLIRKIPDLDRVHVKEVKDAEPDFIEMESIPELEKPEIKAL